MEEFSQNLASDQQIFRKNTLLFAQFPIVSTRNVYTFIQTTVTDLQFVYHGISYHDQSSEVKTRHARKGRMDEWKNERKLELDGKQERIKRCETTKSRKEKGRSEKRKAKCFSLGHSIAVPKKCDLYTNSEKIILLIMQFIPLKGLLLKKNYPTFSS